MRTTWQIVRELATRDPRAAADYARTHAPVAARAMLDRLNSDNRY